MALPAWHTVGTSHPPTRDKLSAMAPALASFSGASQASHLPPDKVRRNLTSCSWYAEAVDEQTVTLGTQPHPHFC